jgi:hypothetical protein
MEFLVSEMLAESCKVDFMSNSQYIVYRGTRPQAPGSRPELQSDVATDTSNDGRESINSSYVEQL